MRKYSLGVVSAPFWVLSSKNISGLVGLNVNDSGVAATDGLVSLVGSRLATPTTIANPFHNMSISPRVNAVALSGDAPAMMVAAGLALRAMG